MEEEEEEAGHLHTKAEAAMVGVVEWEPHIVVVVEEEKEEVVDSSCLSMCYLRLRWSSSCCWRRPFWREILRRLRFSSSE